MVLGVYTMLKFFLRRVIEAELRVRTIPLKVPEYTPLVMLIMELTVVVKLPR